MSKSIDNKVVSMEFDNSKFESNVKQSMSTLDKLKNALNFDSASKGFEKIESESGKVNMSGLSGAVESVSVKFSALQVMAITALQEITRSAINTGKQLVSSLTIDQVTAGWTKYEQKTASVQTIMNATGKSIDEVNQYLDKLMWFSDETSYSFTDMTSSLGQLTSAGADIDKVIPMIEGIANATAYAGKGTAEFSRAIYNLNQSYSAGYLQYMDWKSLELAGVASKELKQVIIDTAMELGRLDKNATTAEGNLVSIANFGPTLKDKWADTEVMETAFGKFSELTTAAYEAVQAGQFDTASEAIQALSKDYSELSVKAFKSAQEAKSFTEAIEATKDAVSSGWLKTFEIIFGNYEEAKVLWTDLANTLWDMFASGSEARNELLDDALSSKWPSFIAQINEAGIATEDFEAAVIEAGKASGIAIEDIIEEAGSLKAAVDKGLISKKVLTDALKSLNKLNKGQKTVTKTFEDFRDVVKKVWGGDFDNGEKRIKALTEAGWDYAEVQALVNKCENGRLLTMEDLNEEQRKAIETAGISIDELNDLATALEDANSPLNELIASMEKPTGRELLIDSFNNGLQTIIATLDIVKSAWTDTFGVISAEDIYGVLEKVNGFSSKTLTYITNNADAFGDILRGIFAVIDIIVSFVGSAALTTIKKILKVLGYANSDILTVAQSMGLAMVKLRDWLKGHRVISNVYGIFTDYIVEMIGAIYNWIKAFVKLPKVEENLKRIESVLSDLSYSGVKSFFDGGVAIIREFISTLWQINGITFDTFLDEVKGLFGRLWDYFSNLSNLSPELGKTMTILAADASVGFGAFENNFSSFRDAIKSIVDWFKNVLPKDLQISVGNILAIGIGASLIKMMNGVTKVLKKVGNIVDVFANIAGSVSKFIEGIAGVINSIKTAITDLSKAQAKKIKSEAWLNIAKSLLYIAGAIAILALLPTDKMLIAAGALVVLIGAMALLAKSVGKMGDTTNFAKVGIAFLSMAGALLVIGMALKKIDKLKNPIQSALIAVGLLAALVLLGQVAAKYSSAMEKGIVYMIPMAAAILVLAIAMKTLSSIHFSEMMTGIVGLAACVVAMALLMLVCKKLNAADVVPAIVAAGALILMVIAFKMVSKLKPEDIILGLVNIIGILSLLVPIFLATRIAGKEAIKSGGSILAISASLILIAIAMKMISTLEPDDIARATLAIMGIIGMLGVVIAALSLLKTVAGEKSNAGKAALTIAAMAVAIVAIAAAMMILSLIKEEPMKRALAAVATIMGLFALLIAASGLSKDCYKTITGIAVVIGVLAIALGALSMIPAESLESATKALVAVMAMLAVVIAATGLAKKAMGTLIVLGVLAGLLTALLGHLENVNCAPSIETALAFGILITTLAGSMAILSLAKGISWATIGQIAVLGAIVVALAGIIGYLESMNLTVSIENAASLSLLIASLSASAVLLSIAGKAGFKAGLAGVGVLGVLIAGLGVVLAALGGLNEWTKGEAGKLLNEGIPMLQAIGEGLGRFAGAIVGGVVRGLVGTGEDLTKFMVNLKGFIAGCGTITPEVAAGMKSLATGLLALTAAELIDGIGKFFGKRGSLEELGKELSEFGPYMKKFADSMKGVNSKDLETGCNAFKMISEASSQLSRHDGLWQKIVGDNKISDFVQMLADCFASTDGKQSPFGMFVDGLRRYSGQWDAIEANSKSFLGVLDTVSDFANTLAAHDGVLQMVKGDNKINDFVKMLSDCFYEEGTTNLSNGAFPRYVKGLTRYADKFETIRTNTKSFIDVLVDLSDFSNTLAKHGGFASFLSGDNKLSSFINDLATVIDPFKTFVDGLNSITDDWVPVKNNIASMSSVLSKISQISDAIPENYSELFSGKPLTKISRDLSGSAINFKTFVTYMNGVSGARLTELGNGIAALVSAVSEATKASNSKLSDFSEKLSNLGKTVVNFFKESIQSKTEEVKQSGAKVAEACISGIDSKKTNVLKSGQAAFTSFKSGLGSTANYNTSKQAGAYFAQGFIDGIKGKNSAVKSAAWSIGNTANNALKNAVQERSPSKITYGFGEYYVEGFVNGIKNNIQNAAKTSEDLGQTSINSLRDVMNRVSDAILTDVDTQPTIRPVLDLSEVESGANTLNGLFNNMQPVGTINTAMPFALASSAGTVATNQAAGVNMNFTIYGAEGQDVNQLAEIVSQKINISLNRRSNTWR